MTGTEPGAVIEFRVSAQPHFGGVLSRPDHPPRPFDGRLELFSLIEEWFAEQAADDGAGPDPG